MNFLEKALAQAERPTITQVDINTNIQTIFTNIITWALYIGGAVAVVYLIYGGFIYITSAGDETKAEQGKIAITNSLIGVIVISLAIVIVTWASEWVHGIIR